MAKRDRIALVGLRAHGRHGVYDFERAEGQEFVVDVTLHTSVRDAAASDDVADTVDYGAVAALVVGIVAGEPVNLIETLAERIAGSVLDAWPVAQVEVTVHKPSAPIAAAFADVAVTIVRSRG